MWLRVKIEVIRRGSSVASKQVDVLLGMNNNLVGRGETLIGTKTSTVIYFSLEV